MDIDAVLDALLGELTEEAERTAIVSDNPYEQASTEGDSTEDSSSSEGSTEGDSTDTSDTSVDTEDYQDQVGHGKTVTFAETTAEKEKKKQWKGKGILKNSTPTPFAQPWTHGNPQPYSGNTSTAQNQTQNSNAKQISFGDALFQFLYDPLDPQTIQNLQPAALNANLTVKAYALICEELLTESAIIYDSLGEARWASLYRAKVEEFVLARAGGWLIPSDALREVRLQLGQDDFNSRLELAKRVKEEVERRKWPEMVAATGEDQGVNGEPGNQQFGSQGPGQADYEAYRYQQCAFSNIHFHDGPELMDIDLPEPVVYLPTEMDIDPPEPELIHPLQARTQTFGSGFMDAYRAQAAFGQPPPLQLHPSYNWPQADERQYSPMDLDSPPPVLIHPLQAQRQQEEERARKEQEKKARKHRKKAIDDGHDSKAAEWFQQFARRNRHPSSGGQRYHGPGKQAKWQKNKTEPAGTTIPTAPKADDFSIKGAASSNQSDNHNHHGRRQHQGSRNGKDPQQSDSVSHRAYRNRY